MIPIKQTKVGKQGNCFEACIASVLECSIEDIPNIRNEKHECCNEILNEWLSQRGLFYLELRVLQGHEDLVFGHGDFYYFQIGLTERSEALGGLGHCVVCKQGRMVFDPHPSSAGLLPSDENALIGVFLSTLCKV